MLAKKYRLREREVKKVLQKGKPFFSDNIVFNVIPNKLSHARFAIVISWKSVPNNVIRNNFRRMFYEVCKSYSQLYGKDIVCVVKVKTKLDNSPEKESQVHKELLYLFDKKLWKNT